MKLLILNQWNGFGKLQFKLLKMEGDITEPFPEVPDIYRKSDDEDKDKLVPEKLFNGNPKEKEK